VVVICKLGDEVMKEIIVVGLGPGGLEHLTLGTWELLSKASRLYLRTAIHPAAQELSSRGIKYKSFDDLYERKESFAEVYQEIVRTLLAEAAGSAGQSLVYAVPGHPLVAEATVGMLLSEAPKQGIKVTVKSGLSFLDTALALLGVDPSAGLVILDALSLVQDELNPRFHTIITQVYNRLVASDLKLQLLECYPPSHPVVIVKSAGIAGVEEKITLPLVELDHGEYFDHLTSVYLGPGVPCQEKAQAPYSAEPLFAVMEELLSPHGCPWDREQDHVSLRPYLIEEAYEVAEAIDSGKMDKLAEELGDVLLQVVFHSLLAEKNNEFTFADVVAGVTEKMIRRHPHVFGELSVSGSEEVLRNWEQIKAREKGQDAAAKPRVMAKLNRALPALLQAEEVQKKAAKVGFDWEDIQGAWDKVYEELDELKQACNVNNSSIEEEMGDLLFAVVNVCRFLKVSPELALLKTVNKFLRRFAYIEDKLQENGVNWKEMDLKSLDIIWEEAKKADI